MISNLERIFSRAKRNKYIGQGLTLDDYKFQSVTRTYSLTSGGSISGQPVDFPSGAIIISVGMEASMAAQAATASRGTLDMVRVAMDLPSQDGTLTAGGLVRASCLFGRANDRQWPEREVIMPRQGSITVSLLNLTTSTLDVDLVFNVLIPRGAF